MSLKTKIHIRFEHDGRISIVADPASGVDPWPETVNFFQRHCTSVEVNNPARTIKLDWWDLAGFLDKLHEFNRIQPNAVFQPDAEAARHIQEAIRSRDNTVSDPPRPITAQEAIETLATVGFQRNLTTHQARNVAKLASLYHGATFSVPGAGKTTEAFATFLIKRIQFNPPLDQLLVVCPKNAFPAWDEQVEACMGPNSEWKPVRLVGGYSAIRHLLKSNPPKLALITYQQLASGQTAQLVSTYLHRHPSAMFLDESHRIKRGTAGTWANAVASIAHIPKLKLTMSGTPMPNGLADLVPQFRFLFPAVPATDPNFLDKVRRTSVRTTKAELGLPPVNAVRVEIPMTVDQARLYNLMANRTARQLESSLSSSDRNTLRKAASSYQILLQAVTHPALLASKLDSYEIPYVDAALASDSPKFAYACERARRLAAQGKKTLIWTHFVSNVETLASRLADVGAVFIHGGVETRGIEPAVEDPYDTEANDEWDADWVQDDASREEILHKFHNDKNCMVLVANPQACAEGISLHQVCHHAIYIDRNYQAATFLQSQDRIHRLGLPPDTETTLEYLISPGTIDISVDRRLDQKIQMMIQVLNDPSIQAPTVTKPYEEIEQDIRDLLEVLRGNPSRNPTST